MASPWLQYGLTQDEYDHVTAIFVTFDYDDSGELSSRELSVLARYLNFPHKPEDVRRMFLEMDTDRSRKLDLHEFCTWLKRHRPDSMQLYGLSQHDYDAVLFQFHKHDRDQNGLLNRTEFVALSLEERWADNRQAAEYMFRAIDFNNDGSVDLDEILEYRKKTQQTLAQSQNQHSSGNYGGADLTMQASQPFQTQTGDWHV